VDGQFAAAVVPKPVAPVSVQIGGQNGIVLYAGTVPGSVAGLMQINVQLPPQLPSGDVPIVVMIGAASSQPGVTVALQ
jgi:uncharacterized protein (TIGR03437 family)